MRHIIGNYYKLLGHIIKLENIDKHNGCKLSCGPGCCTKGPGLKVECLFEDLDEMELIKRTDEASEIDWQKGDVAEIKEGWDIAGTKFTVLGPAIFLKQWWVPIEDPDERDPDFHKEAGLKKGEKNEN